MALRDGCTTHEFESKEDLLHSLTWIVWSITADSRRLTAVTAFVEPIVDNHTALVKRREREVGDRLTARNHLRHVITWSLWNLTDHYVGSNPYIEPAYHFADAHSSLIEGIIDNNA